MDPQSDTFTTLVHALQEALPSPIPSSASPMAQPGNFSGEAAACSGFLLQCSLYLEMQPQLFPTERSKIAFIISLLSGRALQWAEALWNADSPQVNSLESFVEHFREVFSLSTTKVYHQLYMMSCYSYNKQIHPSMSTHSVAGMIRPCSQCSAVGWTPLFVDTSMRTRWVSRASSSKQAVYPSTWLPATQSP